MTTRITARQVVAGLLTSSAAAWIRQLATLVLYVVAARWLAPETIGVFALASALVLAVEYGVFDAISETVVQRPSLEPAHLGAALTMAAVAAGVCTLLGVLLAGWLAWLFAVPDLARVLPWMAGGVALLCLAAVHAGMLRRAARFHVMSLLQAASALAACALGIALMILGWGIWSLVAYFIAEKAMFGLGALLATLRQPISRYSRRHVIDLAGYATAIGGQRVSYFLRSQMDRLLIAWLWGTDVLGAYQLAARVFESVGATLLAPASKLFFVAYTRLQGDPAGLRKTVLRSFEAVGFIGLPAFAGLAAVGPATVQVLFGQSWSQSELLLQILALGGIPLIINIMSGTTISALGRARLYLGMELAGVVIGAVLIAALTPLGIIGVAAALILRESVIAVAYGFLLRMTLGVRLREMVQVLAATTLTSLAMAGVVFLSLRWAMPDASPVLRLAAGIGLGASFYAVIMAVIQRRQIVQAIALVRGRAAGVTPATAGRAASEAT